MADPPFDEGACQLTTAAPLALVAVTFVGTLGATVTVTEFDALE
jgi:hypothetical protein